jgi:hypothetical protein
VPISACSVSVHSGHLAWRALNNGEGSIRPRRRSRCPHRFRDAPPPAASTGPGSRACPASGTGGANTRQPWPTERPGTCWAVNDPGLARRGPLGVFIRVQRHHTELAQFTAALGHLGGPPWPTSSAPPAPADGPAGQESAASPGGGRLPAMGDGPGLLYSCGQAGAPQPRIRLALSGHPSCPIPAGPGPDAISARSTPTSSARNAAPAFIDHAQRSHSASTFRRPATMHVQMTTAARTGRTQGRWRWGRVVVAAAGVAVAPTPRPTTLAPEPAWRSGRH